MIPILLADNRNKSTITCNIWTNKQIKTQTNRETEKQIKKKH